MGLGDAHSVFFLSNKNISYPDRGIENVLSVSLNNKYMSMYVYIFLCMSWFTLYRVPFIYVF